ncbi:unnamed protein product, partial [marine sediment metagenome]
HKVDKIIMSKSGDEVNAANPNDSIVIPGLAGLNPYAILRIKK